MARQRTQVLVEVALSVAMAAVLWGLFHLALPINAFGGEIAFTMVPIMVISLRRGVLAGVAAGAIFGMFMLLVEPYVVHPVQVVLDYPLAFGMVGLTGLGAPAYRAAVEAGNITRAGVIGAASCLLGALGRLLAHVVSGVIFFASNAPAGQPVLIYSIAYNATYILPSALLSIPAAVIVLLALERTVPSTTATAGGV